MMSAAIRNASSSDPVQDTNALISDSRIAPESRRLHRAAPHPFPPKALWRFMPVESRRLFENPSDDAKTVVLEGITPTYCLERT
jgi:hypothetical protein